MYRKQIGSIVLLNDIKAGDGSLPGYNTTPMFLKRNEVLKCDVTKYNFKSF